MEQSSNHQLYQQEIKTFISQYTRAIEGKEEEKDSKLDDGDYIIMDKPMSLSD